jgi:hypothetical protein
LDVDLKERKEKGKENIGNEKNTSLISNNPTCAYLQPVPSTTSNL